MTLRIATYASASTSAPTCCCRGADGEQRLGARPRLARPIVASSGGVAARRGGQPSPPPSRALLPHHHAARGPAPPAATRKTYASFDDMIKESPTPVLVDFHAAWCGPCRLMSDSIEATARELGPDTVTAIKIDVDKYPALASRFRVAALPTVLLFRGGSPVDRVEGYLSPPDLASRVRYYCQSLDLKFGKR